MPSIILIHVRDHTSVDPWKSAGMPNKGDIARVEDHPYSFGTSELDLNNFVRVVVTNRTKVEIAHFRDKRDIISESRPQRERRYRVPGIIVDQIISSGGEITVAFNNFNPVDRGA